MNKHGIGVLFCIIATILIATHYLSTAIYLSNTQSWSKELFISGLGYTGYFLDILSVIAWVIGIICLFLGEKTNNK